MHPIYKLKETHLDEPHQNWIGREVADRYGRRLGHVKEILVEERTLEDALKDDQDPQGWVGKADFAVVTVETGLLGRLKARHVVMLPIDTIAERDGVLTVDEDGDEIRVALAS
jgi:hypothetical protein